MIFVLVALLILKKSIPPILFTILPVIAALIAGFSIFEVGEFASAGIKSMISTVSLFVFSISFFSLMSDEGVFDFLVGKLAPLAGNSVTAVMMITAVVAVIAHLDGSGATTLLITIPAMLPFYKKYKIRPQALMLITITALGVMNMVPWGGPTIRAATVIGMDAGDLWRPLIPVQGIALILTLVEAFIIAKIEIRHGACLQADVQTEETSVDAQTTNKAKLLVNFILTIVTIAILMSDILPSNFVFMIATAVGLIINIRAPKEQSERLKKYGASAMSMTTTLLTAGIFVGILNNSGMIDAMATSIVNVIPEALGAYTFIIIAIFSVPLIMCLGTDSFYYGLMPVVIGVAGTYGVPAEIVARALIITENIGIGVSPVTPTIYLGLGLLDMDIGTHIRYSALWIWGLSIIMLFVSIIMGVIPVRF